MAKTLPRRAEVPEEQTWDVHSIFPSDEAWAAALHEAGEGLPELQSF